MIQQKSWKYEQNIANTTLHSPKRKQKEKVVMWKPQHNKIKLIGHYSLDKHQLVVLLS
jgi:hypothetical protein